MTQTLLWHPTFTTHIILQQRSVETISGIEVKPITNEAYCYCYSVYGMDTGGKGYVPFFQSWGPRILDARLWTIDGILEGASFHQQDTHLREEDFLVAPYGNTSRWQNRSQVTRYFRRQGVTDLSNNPKRECRVKEASRQRLMNKYDVYNPQAYHKPFRLPIKCYLLVMQLFNLQSGNIPGCNNSQTIEIHVTTDTITGSVVFFFKLGSMFTFESSIELPFLNVSSSIQRDRCFSRCNRSSRHQMTGAGTGETWQPNCQKKATSGKWLCFFVREAIT